MVVIIGLKRFTSSLFPTTEREREREIERERERLGKIVFRAKALLYFKRN